MVAYFLSLVVLIPGILGWGYLFGRAIGSNERETFTISEHGFLGILAYGVVALCINFFWPLTTTVALAVLVAGYMFFVYSRKLFYRDFHGRSEIIAFISLLAFMSLVRAHNSFEFDLGLYHLPAIVWNHASSVPLGLANLHNRFGFNSLWPVVSSVMWLPWFELKGVFSSNAVITFFFFLGLLQWMLRNGMPDAPSPSRLFSVLIVLFLIFVGNRLMSAGSPSNDWPAACATLYAFFLGLRLSETPVDSGEFRRQWCLLCLVSILAIMIKLSQLPVALVPLYFAIVYLKEKHDFRRRELSVAVGFVAAASLLWLGRGFLLSGCLIYPWPQSCAEAFAWSVPVDRVTGLAKTITAFARQPGGDAAVVLADWSWLREWGSRFLFGPEHKTGNAHTNQALVLMFVVGIVICTIAAAKRRIRFGDSKVLALWLISLAGVAFWFFTAPSERFGYGFLVPMAFILLILGLRSFDFSKTFLVRATPAAAYLLIAVLLAVSAAGLARILVRNGETYANWPKIPDIATTEHLTAHGKLVKVPVEKYGRCWNVLPVCAPEFDPKLKIARAGRWTIFRAGNE